MTNLDGLKYEHFIRNAFSIERDNPIDMSEDPAGLASSYLFEDDNINRIKVGVCYAMEIYNNHIIETLGGDSEAAVSDKDNAAMKKLIDKVLNAAVKEEIIPYIEQYKSIRDKYFKHKWMDDPFRFYK